jgi:hypothetical protein
MKSVMEPVGTHVPAEVKREVQAEAQRAGMSVAAWLRLQLLQLTERGPDPLDKVDPNEEDRRDRVAAA